jgi:4-amino-4-deoxy-L-arabinose transferase-like glycosyltransferase
MIATEGTTVLRPESPAEFIGNYWLDTGHEAEFRTRYPAGLPALLAVAYRAGGPTLALAVNPLLALLSVVLLFFLARRWFSARLALAASFICAALPLLGEQALAGFAHVAVVAVLLLALNLLDLWQARPRPLTGLLVGLSLGVLPTIRYPAAVLTAAGLVYVALKVWPNRLWRALAFVLIGAGVPILALLLHNWISYSTVVRTGYALTLEQGAFGFGYFWHHLPWYGIGLLRDGGPVVLVGLVGMIVMTVRPDSRERGLLLLGATVPITVLYAAYYLNYVRFLLPTLPMYILGAAGLLHLINARMRAWALIGLIGLQGFVWASEGLGRVQRLGNDIQRSEQILHGVEDLVPEGSVIVAPAAVARILDYHGRWKLGDWSLLWVGSVPRITTVPPPIAPDGTRQPSPQQPGKGESLRRSYQGLDPGSRIEAVLGDLARWADGEAIFWLVGEDEEWLIQVDSQLNRPLPRERIGSIPSSGPGADPVDVAPSRWWWVPDLPLHVFRIDPAAVSDAPPPR